MITPPKKLIEAQAHRYGSWGGCPEGEPYDPKRCAWERLDPIMRLPGQCTRKPGKGPGGLYCGQHAKMVRR